MSDMNQQMDDSAVVELTGKIMVVAIIVLFVVVVFVFFLHLYAKWFWYRQEHDGAGPSRRRQELAVVTALRHGLDPSVLKSIPVVKFAAKDFKDGLECAVCLSEVSDGEKARMLPKCNHGFHVECIDMWFQSHSTCPLCRNPISNPSSSNSAESSLESILQTQPQDHSNSNLTESLNFPTNVLFWGNETQVSTLGSSLEEENSSAGPTTTTTASSSSTSSSSSNSRPDGALVIDIPSQMNEEEDQNPKSPMPSRMRSLKRLLSRNRLINPCSPRNVEVVEHMGRGQT